VRPCAFREGTFAPIPVTGGRPSWDEGDSVAVNGSEAAVGRRERSEGKDQADVGTARTRASLQPSGHGTPAVPGRSGGKSYGRLVGWYMGAMTVSFEECCFRSGIGRDSNRTTSV
jgi:hypothetical protein